MKYLGNSQKAFITSFNPLSKPVELTLFPIISDKTGAQLSEQSCLPKFSQLANRQMKTQIHSLFQKPVLLALDQRPKTRKDCLWEIQKPKQSVPGFIILALSGPYPSHVDTLALQFLGYLCLQVSAQRTSHKQFQNTNALFQS